jgi:polyisoprenoid-binding protein YceI
MKRKLILITIIGLFFVNAGAQQKYNAVAEKSTLAWTGEKVTGQHSGTIKLKSGSLTIKDNKIVGGEFDIDMTTIKDSEGNERLEGHLKSGDFFDATNFPVSKLVINESTAFEKGTGVAKGTLTIKGVTNPVEIKATMQKKDDGVWFFTNIDIDRTKYNVKYGSGSFFDNLGDKTIYDDFRLKVNLLVN